jgi:hypothetical protein
MRKRLLLIPLIAAPVLWGLVYWQGSHSDAMKFVQNKVRNSPAIQSRIGVVSDVHMPLFGSYHASYSTLENHVRMDVDATGNKGSAVINVEVDGDDGVWKIKRALIEGESITLD